MKHLISTHQRKVIQAVTVGNILEWFEIYSYGFLVPIFASKFFHFDKEIWNWAASFSLFGIGFFARLLGIYLFGHIGDLLGRQKAFILSITMMTIPTFVVGYIPDYALWGGYAPLMLLLLRLIQSVPVAGESPGTACILYENSQAYNRIFITSWASFGNQIGAILGVLETFFVEEFVSEAFLMSWGWRISFWLGGFIGLFGIYLRRRLEETPMFEKVEHDHKVDPHTFRTIWKQDKKAVFVGIGYGIINSATFYMLATYIPAYFDGLIGLSKIQNGMVSLVILVLSTLLLPFFGYFGDKWDNRKMLIFSSISIIIFTGIIYYLSSTQQHLVALAVTATLYIFPVTCISALMGNLLAQLFDTPVRFTGISLTFNIADGLVGGFAPVASIILYKLTSNQASFCWYLLASGIVSLYFFIRYCHPRRGFLPNDV